jgi:hypothetical protein
MKPSALTKREDRLFDSLADSPHGPIRIVPDEFANAFLHALRYNIDAARTRLLSALSIPGLRIS